MVSDLDSQTEDFSSSLVTINVQKWALCSNFPANVQASVKRVNVLEKT